MDILSWIQKISFNFFHSGQQTISKHNYQTQTKKLCIQFAFKTKNHFGINFSFFFRVGNRQFRNINLKPNTKQKALKTYINYKSLFYKTQHQKETEIEWK